MSNPCPVNYYNNKHYNDAEIGIINAHHNAVVEYLQSKGLNTNTGKIEVRNNVNFVLKAVDILQSDKAKQIFDKGNKNNWSLDKILSELQVPKEQKALLLDLDITDREQIALELVSNYSYAIEINKAVTVDELPFGDDGKIVTPTQYYSNLTVTGGTNYTENEISTPLITPSIKGHAQFATDKGIGWFRSDDKANRVYNKEEEVKDENNNVIVSGGYSYIKDDTKTRRILEVQSDLFQKGRDKDKIVNWQEMAYDLGDIKTKQANNFLQLLNKDSNWVTFFIKSIIQDSAKKGYEKVLFPSGNTASKVEGHTTLEEFIKTKQDRLDYLYTKKVDTKNLDITDDYIYGDSEFLDIGYRRIGDKWYQEVETDLNDFAYTLEEIKNLGIDAEIVKKPYKSNTETEINQLENEITKIKSDGIAALKPIYNFYENTVTNILNKTYGKENITQITDEYGNTWNEVDASLITFEDRETDINDILSPLKVINNKYNANVTTLKDDGTVEIDMSIVADELIGNNTIQLSKPSNRIVTKPETLNSFDRKLEILKKAIPNVEVILDTTINNKGQVSIENGKKVIRINPNAFTNDTLVHEFGHLYIDILIADGYGSMIQNGINQLKDTNLWKEVTELYPELNETDLGKEVLATAIGLESTELSDRINNPTILNKILSILDSIYKALKRLLGIDYNVARELAKELVTNNVISNDVSLILSFEQYNSKKTQEEARILLDSHNVGKTNINNKNRYSYTLPNGTIVYSSQSMTEWIRTGKDFDASDAARFAAIQNLKIPTGVVITEEMNQIIDEEAIRIQNSWYTGSAIGTNIHKLFEDVFEKDAILSDISEYFSSNIEGITVNKQFIKEFETNFHKLVQVARDIKRRHPGAIFYTEYKIIDTTSPNPIAGTIDLLVLNPDGTVSIYDFKTSVNAVYETINGRQKLTQNYVNNTFEKHAKQLFGYAAILQKNFGLQTVDFNIVPVHIDMEHLGNFKGIVTNVGPQPFIEVNSFVASRAIRQNVNAEFKVEPSFKLDSAESLTVVNTYLKHKIKDTELFIKSTLSNRTAEIDVKALNKIANDLVNIEGIDSILTNIKHLENLYEQLLKDYRDAMAGAFILSNISGVTHKITTKQKVEFMNTLNYLTVMTESTTEMTKLSKVKADELDIEKDVLKPLNSISGQIKRFKTVINEEILEDLADKLVDKTDIGKIEYRKKYELEFSELNVMKSTFGLADTYYIGTVKVSREAWVHARNQYVQQKFKENEEEIYNFANKVAKAYVKKIPFDIPFEYATLEVGEFNNYIIKYVNTKLRDLDIERQQGFLDKRSEIIQRLSKLKLNTPLGQITNPEVVFGKYIEGDHLVTKYKDSFLYGEDGYYDMLSKQTEFTKKIKKALAENKVEDVEKLHKEKDLAKATWMSNNTIKIKDNTGKNRVFPSSKHSNPKFDEVKDDPLYKLLLELVMSGDALLNSNKLKLSNTTFNTVFIKLPSLSKSKMEAITSGGFFDKLRQAWQVNPEDTDFQLTPTTVIDQNNILNELDLLDKINSEDVLEANVNVEGKTIPNINFGFRGLIGTNREEHIKNVSKDLIASLMANYDTSLNYNLKAQFKDEFSLVVSALEDSGVSKTIRRGNSPNDGLWKNITGLRGLTKAVTTSTYLDEKGEEFDVTDPNTDTRWLKALNGLIEQKLLGIKLKGSVKSHNVANAVNTLAGLYNLTLNKASAVANYAAGLFSLYRQSGAGNVINLSSVNKAVGASLVENVIELYDSFNSVVPTTKNGALSEKFNVRSQTVTPEYHLLQKNKAFRLIGFQATNVLNNIVEANLSNIALKSVLYNIKLKNKDGKFINSKGEIVTDPNDAIDYYSAVGYKDNMLVYPDLYLDDGKTPISSLAAQKRIQKTISDLNMKSQGYYQQDAVVEAKRTAMGKSLMSMKWWLPPYINNQYRYFRYKESLEQLDNIGYINYYDDGTSDIGIETQYFDHLLNSYRKNYSTYEHANIIKKILFSTAKTMFDNTENFNKLSYDARRKIIVANRTGLFMIMTSIMTSMLSMLLLQSFDDDEKEEIRNNDIKAIKKNIKEAQKELKTETDESTINGLKGNIVTWEKQLEEGLPDNAVTSFYFNDPIAKKIAKLNPDNYYKDKNNKYYPKQLKITAKEIKLFGGVKLFDSDKPLIALNSERENWDLIYTGAVLLNRIKDESQQFSILSTSTALVEGPKAILSPATSALKIIQSPSAALGLVPAVSTFVDNVFGVFKDEPNDYHLQNKRSSEFPSVYENIKYTKKDKLLKSIIKYGKPTDFEKMYETIYGKAERLQGD